MYILVKLDPIIIYLEILVGFNWNRIMHIY